MLKTGPTVCPPAKQVRMYMNGTLLKETDNLSATNLLDQMTETWCFLTRQIFYTATGRPHDYGARLTISHDVGLLWDFMTSNPN